MINVHTPTLEEFREIERQLSAYPFPRRIELNEMTLERLRVRLPRYDGVIGLLFGIPLHIDNSLANGAIRPVYQ